MQTKPYLFSTSSHRDTIHINPLKISFFNPEIDFFQYDYMILTSKQAVKALGQYTYNSYKDKEALCISKATAQSFKDIKGKVLQTGSGYGDDLSRLIDSYPKDTKWLYIRAQKVASSFVKVSNAKGYDIDEVIVYKSECSDDIQTVELPSKAILIFTSPSSVNCFLKYNKFEKDYTVVVIGKTTEKALSSDTKPFIAEEQSVESCLKIINSL